MQSSTFGVCVRQVHGLILWLIGAHETAATHEQTEKRRHDTMPDRKNTHGDETMHESFTVQFDDDEKSKHICIDSCYHSCTRKSVCSFLRVRAR